LKIDGFRINLELKCKIEKQFGKVNSLIVVHTALREGWMVGRKERMNGREENVIRSRIE